MPKLKDQSKAQSSKNKELSQNPKDQRPAFVPNPHLRLECQPKNMLIGIDGIPLAFPKTGVGHYTYELARGLSQLTPANQFEILYPSSFAPIKDFEEASNLKTNRVPVGPVGRHWWSTGLPRYVSREGFALFHGTNYDVPLWRRCPTVVTVHDLSQLLFPETHEKRSVKRARLRLPLMARTADAVIVPTEAVRSELQKNLGLVKEKVFVVPEAARQIFKPVQFSVPTGTARERFGIGDDFILTVGTLEPRKNIETLVSAFEIVAKENDAQLVIAGGRGWLSGPLFSQIAKSPVRHRIVLTEYLEDEDLRELYCSCKVFVYPSLYEGFGLPPLEAMACGAAVIASRIPTLVETTGDAAILVEPKNIAELAEAILGLLSDTGAAEDLAKAGLERASQFSWYLTALKTMAVYERVLGIN